MEQSEIDEISRDVSTAVAKWKMARPTTPIIVSDLGMNGYVSPQSQSPNQTTVLIHFFWPRPQMVSHSILLGKCSD